MRVKGWGGVGCIENGGLHGNSFCLPFRKLFYTHAHCMQVDAIVVGADRVAANGDTANKIGTYSLAVAAQYHNIPFFIAAPTTTIDPQLPDGSLIPIEQRDPAEVGGVWERAAVCVCMNGFLHVHMFLGRGWVGWDWDGMGGSGEGICQ